MFQGIFWGTIGGRDLIFGDFVVFLVGFIWYVFFPFFSGCGGVFGGPFGGGMGGERRKLQVW